MNGAAVFERIAKACERSGRDPGSVRLLGASKKQTPETINRYIAWCNQNGQRALIGENYVQEWEEKHSLIRGEFDCHFIGHLQSNKSKIAASLFSAVQCVDSLKLAQKLDAASLKKKLPVFLQVNISDDEAKSGLSPEQAEPLALEIAEFPHLSLAGLMTIPKLYQESEKVRLDYRSLKSLSNRISRRIGQQLELSMGMSDDFEIAIEEGATIVRVGTLLFGERP